VTERGQDPLPDLPDVALLTADEVAAALRISRKLVYRLVRDGELASVRVGSSLRVPVAALRSYVRRSWASRDEPDPDGQPTPA
jgi:excisionase family DNA binding protein